MKAEDVLEVFVGDANAVAAGRYSFSLTALQACADSIAAAHEAELAWALKRKDSAWNKQLDEWGQVVKNQRDQLAAAQAQLAEMGDALEAVIVHYEPLRGLQLEMSRGQPILARAREILAAAPRKLLWLGTEGVIGHRISYTAIDSNTWVLEVEGERLGEDGEEGIQVMAFRLPKGEQADSSEQVMSKSVKRRLAVQKGRDAKG